ncbi:MAG TPA: efflux RND transporter periplasmic adaptor subunit, partial [Longimicrobiales bacterium]|nr:efflux RND transporter periplasmic adaptor subunit [Longimicrobiales bacterium]
SEALARVEAAEAAAGEAEIAAQTAATEAERTRRLHEGGAATRRDLERTAAEHAQALAALETARAELAAARAARDGASQLPPEVLRAPTAGRVLTVHRESQGYVNPGEALMEIGDTRRLEVTADVLSQDAVRIPTGAAVRIDDWGGTATLQGVVTRVEPEGFTEVSALGVEERRVPVRAAITSPPSMWADLGSGYRVLATFVVWQGDSVLQVPTAALFRSEEGWAVFVVDGSRARHREVDVGHQADLRAQILSGVEEGQEVIIHPPNELEDGARVDVR